MFSSYFFLKELELFFCLSDFIYKCFKYIFSGISLIIGKQVASIEDYPWLTADIGEWILFKSDSVDAFPVIIHWMTLAAPPASF